MAARLEGETKTYGTAVLLGPDTAERVTVSRHSQSTVIRLRGRTEALETHVLQYAWLGPLVGAMTRPFGGWLADKLGGANVTLWNFVVMAMAVIGVI